MNSSATRSVGYLDWEFREILPEVPNLTSLKKKKKKILLPYTLRATLYNDQAKKKKNRNGSRNR